ncbi:MAG: outer membrane lipoprotein-sorting protein [Candidatus Neomarinimicrobiota bacterium]|nr:MAG: outer membrane lipoprotein-sorting protein [Candidatus Neomarinimicrobiota bacterium]
MAKIRMILPGLLLVWATAQTPPSPAKIMERVLNHPHPASTVSTITLTMKKTKGKRVKTKVRELMRYHKSYSEGVYRSKTMMRFLKPAVAKGIGLLTWNYRDGHSDQWLYLPKLKKAKKIAVSEQSKSLLGTEFSYEDLQETSLDTASLSYGGEAVLDSIPCQIVDQRMPASRQYSHRRIWVSTGNWLIKKVEYFDHQNRPVKVLDIPEHIRQDRFWFTRKMIMHNLLNGNESILEVNDIQVNTGLVDDFFSQTFLTKLD